MSLRQCDGPDLDELLARAAREHGPSARVVKAEKVRRGGVGGFFAREWFELSIEVPDGAADVDALAEETEDVLDLSDTIAAAVPASGTRTESGAQATPVADPADWGLFGPDPVDPVATGQQPDPATADVTEPVELPSTETSEFEALLASLTGGPRPAPVPNTPAPVARGEGTEPAHPAAIDPAAAAPLAPSADRRHGTYLSRIDPAPSAGAGRVAALTRAGLPRDLVVALAGVSPAEWARTLGQLLPPLPPLPQLAGSILAVVGPIGEATRLARELSRRIGCEGEIHLVSRTGAAVGVPLGMVLPDAAAVGERARRFARSPHPIVVAVAVDGESGVTRWLAEIVGRLRPDQTWLCATAGARVEDVWTLADVLGGVDVLTVHGAGRVPAPAALLELRLPIGLVDDNPAVAAELSALLRATADDPLPDQIAYTVTGLPAIAGQIKAAPRDTSPAASVTSPESGATPRRSSPAPSDRFTQRRAAAERVAATDDAVARLRGRVAR